MTPTRTRWLACAAALEGATCKLPSVVALRLARELRFKNERRFIENAFIWYNLHFIWFQMGWQSLNTAPNHSCLEVTRRVRRACEGVGLKARDGKRPFFGKSR